jgi:ATP-dependent DNA ligase
LAPANPGEQSDLIPELVPQLAESIDKNRLPAYLADDRWWFEQKVDGQRKLVWLIDGRVSARNRQGEPADIPGRCITELPKVTGGVFALDCELVEDRLWVFDLPVGGGLVMPHMPYSYRRDVLDQLGPRLGGDSVQVLPTARTAAQKLNLARKVIESGGEGVMVKDTTAAYLSGIRHPGVLKAKFVKDIDCVITRLAVGGKQNCAVGVYDPGGRLVEVGTVILHAKERNQVDVGSVVTVAYLYCVDPDRPRLVQPTRVRPRSDKQAAECTTDQLRFTDRTVHGLR